MKTVARLFIAITLLAGTVLPALADIPGVPPWPPSVMRTIR
jgi:hypothetical protein